MNERLFGITRVRNEGLIIADTINHFLQWCEHIILYDDCSTDNTVDIARKVGGDRLTVIPGDRWRTDRQMENTRHRNIALKTAGSIGAEWILCFDADERLVGGLPPLEGDGYKFRLFDGYMTQDRQVPYAVSALSTLPRMWGPEYRDIIMLFRADKAVYVGTGRREPKMIKDSQVSLAPVMVKHYGKCLSVDHWEDTCDYYTSYFPEPFRSKWKDRRGKAIHAKSDFNRPLYTWDDLMGNPLVWVKI